MLLGRVEFVSSRDPILFESPGARDLATISNNASLTVALKLAQQAQARIGQGVLLCWAARSLESAIVVVVADVDLGTPISSLAGLVPRA